MGYKSAILFACSVSCVISYFQESESAYLKKEFSFDRVGLEKWWPIVIPDLESESEFP